MEDAQIEIQKEIQKEYRRIDKKWLELHYKTTFGLFFFTVFVECILGWVICNSDQLNTTIPIFILKFIAIPTLLNGLFVFIGYLVIHSKKISQDIKVYTISLLFVGICFVLFTVHVAFSSMYFVFIIPIVLTTIYVNYKLTVITSVSCILSVIVSELFIQWDIDKISIFENSIRFGDFVISFVVLFALSVVCMVVIRFEREKNQASIQKEIERYQLQEKLQIDELTGIYNRKAFRNAIKKMEEDIESQYIFVMIDIDNFKALNDQFGHMAGDRCLIEFGRVLTCYCEDGMPFRFGGDEFCILFQNCLMQDVVLICQKIQKEFQNVFIDQHLVTKLTVSIGISSYDNERDSSRMIINTDKALYEAKVVKNAIRICHC